MIVVREDKGQLFAADLGPARGSDNPGTLAQDWQALRLIVPPLGSMRMTRARSFPACEEDPGDDSADP